MKQKYTKKDGTISVYLLKNKKWIDCNKPYKPQKRGLEKKTILSNRFGLLELYSRKEQQQLMCPSGYSISQCFNILKKSGLHIIKQEIMIEILKRWKNMLKLYKQYKKTWE